jgi:hypothetical protein
VALIGHLIVRLVQIAFGLFLAGIAVTLFLSFGYVRDVAGPAVERATELRLDSLLTAAFAILIAPAVAKAFLAPAALAIALAELAAWRGLVANLLLGGLLALFSGWRSLGLDAVDRPRQGTMVVLLAAGFIAGLVYWAVAGRSAGKWLHRPKAAGLTGSR